MTSSGVQGEPVKSKNNSPLSQLAQRHNDQTTSPGSFTELKCYSPAGLPQRGPRSNYCWTRADGAA